ncbi:3-phosphoshikimate 1-carboxyvinyltransferase [invertebrate metagenome]|uniref:3-phosphoshikimate 1-carboxyvinyltransferase n=1 Tax=invertebrate metagenome TaxID=1711999 RepID=A0A2H9T8M4_9ZZZZ
MSDISMGAEKTVLNSENTLLVIGLGLMGGSVAAAARHYGAFQQIIGYDHNSASLAIGLEKGIIDVACNDISEGLAISDVVVIAVPVLSIEKVFGAIQKSNEKSALSGTVVTDVCSCKAYVVEAARRVFQEVPAWFVPGHPVAGSDAQGISMADGQLFQAQKVILTPEPATDSVALSTVTTLWSGCGADVTFMKADEHDRLLANTSHIPHFIAFSLMKKIADHSEWFNPFCFAGGGLRDFSRIAGSDPRVWHDIGMGNRDALLEGMRDISRGINELIDCIQGNNSDALIALLQKGRSARQRFSGVLERREIISAMKDKQIMIAEPGGYIEGILQVPGDKSISHRAIILGSLAEGVTQVSGFLEGEDALATLYAFESMGVNIEGPSDGNVVIHGVGMNGLKDPETAIDLGNAGTAMRLMAGLMSAQSFNTMLTGDHSLCRRPMKRIVSPLQQMGADIEATGNGTPPLIIKGGKFLQGIHYSMPVGSAQVQSSLLLAGMYAKGKTVVESPVLVRDHTIRMLSAFGYPVSNQGKRVSLEGGDSLKSISVNIPGDISSAAFFIVAATLAEASEVLLTNVGINPTRTGILKILDLMGANITLENQRLSGGEPVADIRVRSSQLKGIVVPAHLVSLAIDEFPVLFIAAAMAEGETRVTGASELRVKESDRIETMAEGLSIMGIKVETLPDGIIIQGSNEFLGGTVDSHGDHRVAMAFVVAALKATREIRILDCANVATSFPNFISLANQAGLSVRPDCI